VIFRGVSKWKKRLIIQSPFLIVLLNHSHEDFFDVLVIFYKSFFIITI
jgi:hypothetical protein